MNFETNMFNLSNTEWLYQPSKENSPHPKEPVRVGIKKLTVICKTCNFPWQAGQHGQEGLQHIAGGYILTCPSCKAEESVKGSNLKCQ